MSSRSTFLSHPLSPATPGYGGQPGFAVERTSSLCAGGSCNQSHWSLSNHIGTHLDAPLHFADQGASVDQVPADFWIFSAPQLLEKALAPSEILSAGSWCESIGEKTDLLLLRTGFESRRGSEDYWRHGPGLAPELGAWLRAHRPQVRMIGFDFLSLTSYDHRPLGREAHRAFLSPEFPGKPVWILEDMHLAKLRATPARVIVSPLRVEGADGSPATVIAEI